MRWWTKNPSTYKVKYSNLVSATPGCHGFHLTHNQIISRLEDFKKTHSNWRQRIHFCKSPRRRFIAQSVLVQLMRLPNLLCVGYCGDSKRMRSLGVEKSKLTIPLTTFQYAHLVRETIGIHFTIPRTRKGAYSVVWEVRSNTGVTFAAKVLVWVGKNVCGGLHCRGQLFA